MNILITTPEMSAYDAVSNDIEAMYGLLSRSHNCKVYTGTVKNSSVQYAYGKELDAILNDKNSIVIYHHSVFWDTGEKLLKAAKGRIVIRYHNITPPEFFDGYSIDFAHSCINGIEQTKRLIRDFPDACWLCNSAYTARGITGAQTAVCPPFNKTERWAETEPDKEVLQRLGSSDDIGLLFVGRMVPNKGHLFLIDILASYVHNFDRKIKLRIIGKFDERLEPYNREILYKIKAYELENNVEFISRVTDSTLLAYYKGSDIFLSASGHEGFFVPAAEAQYTQLPLIARKSSAVTETAGENQILLGSDPKEYAAAIHTLAENEKYKDYLCAQGYDNFTQRFSDKKITETFCRFLENRFGLHISAEQPPANASAGEESIPPFKIKAALVVQRYGAEILGGAELHAKMLAERFAGIPGFSVEVLTTCAFEYTTWKNHYPEGVCDVNGIRVRRFKTDKTRDMRSFDKLTEKLCTSGQVRARDERKWLEMQGPYCPKLISYIKENKNQYDIFVFVTYLYYTTVCGITEASDKAILVPTAHDEPPIYFNMYKDVFNSPKGIAFNTAEERDFIHKLFGIQHIRNDLFGVGVDKCGEANPARFHKKYAADDYILYAGRIEAGKNCPELFDFFIRYKEQHPSSLKLVLIGKEITPAPKHPDIMPLGFVSDNDKTDGIAGAKLCVLPSANESLSIVLLESMSQGVPVLANGRCEVLKGHCERSGAGFHYSDYRGFESALEKLSEQGAGYEKMRRNAQEYVAKNYSWDVIMEKYKTMIYSIKMAV